MPKSNTGVVNKAKYLVDEGRGFANYCDECFVRVFENDHSYASLLTHDENCDECIAFAAGVHPQGPMRRPLEDSELEHILTGLDLFQNMLASGSEADEVLKRELRALGRRLKRGHVTLETLEVAP
ncbi:MAG: hypothetical protein J2P56_06980 [Verrucomicrobia bacterium]|nr:hypothetical protein [Verrucomicrobiota bacterium]